MGNKLTSRKRSDYLAQYIEIPRDFEEIKQKFILGLTKRQCICFGLAGVLGGGVYFLLRDYGTTLASNMLLIAAAPPILFALPAKNGLYFEKRLKNMFHFYKEPHIKPYRTESIYEKADKEREYRKLYRLIYKSVGRR